jgi:spore coat polysaccharide biosynthesis protein SpsF
VTVVIATSDLPGDDPVAAVGDSLGLAVVRGSEQDVLGRYALALALHPARTVVRLTGDCPLTDPALVGAVMDCHEAAGADYTSNVLPRSYPKGLDVEVMSATALRAAHELAVEKPDREHVTPFLYRHPERFRLANLQSGLDLGEEWWTVDTAADLERIRSIVAMLPDPLTAGWEDVLALVGRHAEPGAGEVGLHPLPGPEAGSHPWVRRWRATVDGAPIGEVRVSATAGQGTVELQVADAWADATRTALTRLLGGDQQTRT